MKLLVCGGRDYNDAAYAREVLDRFAAKFGVTKIVSGAAPGADSLASSWARWVGIELAEYPAQWATHGKRAGPIRNQQMLDSEKPDAVLAFPGGRGTADMVRRAEAAGVKVYHVTQRPKNFATPVRPDPISKA